MLVEISKLVITALLPAVTHFWPWTMNFTCSYSKDEPFFLFPQVSLTKIKPLEEDKSVCFIRFFNLIISVFHSTGGTEDGLGWLKPYLVD